jgi:hypothetical protein
MSELALKLIREAKEKKLTSLNLSHFGLEILPLGRYLRQFLFYIRLPNKRGARAHF